MKYRHLRLLTTIVIAVSLAACQSKAVRPPTPPTPVAETDTTGATRYQVDSAASEVHVLVYRGGAMARLGHNHVVSSKNVSGKLFLQDDLVRSRIELTLPTASLIVDDPAARATEGEDFAAEVPADAREGTRRNLLREEVLDAEHHAAITLQSVSISGSRENATLKMRVTIKGVARDVPVSANVQANASRLVASGEFSIKQTDFGITPFSVALGAMQVQDQLRIKFSIVCLKEQ